MSLPLLPIRRRHTERVEREKVPAELVELIAALDVQIAQLRAEVKRMKPVVDAVVDHAKRSTG